MRGPAIGIATWVAALLAALPARADIVKGFVRDSQGKAVFNADFNVYDADTGTKLLASDKTDATGAYRLLVNPGRYDLLCRPVIGTGLAPRIVHDVPIDGTLLLDFVLPAGAQVLGLVTDASNPDPNTNAVHPCKINFDRSDDGSRQPSQGNTTSLFGTFRAFIEAGSYSVTAVPDDSTLAPARIYDWIAPTDEVLQLPLQRAAHMAGTVRNAQGEPVAGVVFKFDIPNGRRQPAGENGTDANGFYRVSILPGVYRVTVEPPLASPYAALRIPDVDVTSSLQRSFTLRAGAAISGVVSDKSGHPVPNARWSALDETGAIVALPNSASGFDGRYRLVVAPGTYRMRLLPPASTGLDSVVFAAFAVARDTTLDIDYALGAGGPGDSPVIRFGPRGNPTHTTAAVTLVLRQPVGAATLEVFDVAGRRVREIFSGPLGPGTHTIAWDGRRENGAQAHTGVFFVRARLDGRERITRFVLLP